MDIIFTGNKLIDLIKDFLGETRNIQFSRYESTIVPGEFMIMLNTPNMNYMIQNKVLLNWISKKNNKNYKCIVPVGEHAICVKEDSFG